MPAVIYQPRPPTWERCCRDPRRIGRYARHLERVQELLRGRAKPALIPRLTNHSTVKARAERGPERLRQVLRKVKTRGQLPVFSANNLPAHARETGRKSSPGAGLRVGEGVKSVP